MIDNLSASINKINETLGIVIRYYLLGLLGIILFEIFSRFLFNSPTIWSYEVLQYSFGAWIFLGGGYTLFRQGHVRMDLIYNKVSSNRLIKFGLDCISFLVIISFCSFFIWQTTLIAWESIKIMETTYTFWAPPLYPYKSIIPIGGLLLLLQAISQFIEDYKIFRNKK